MASARGQQGKRCANRIGLEPESVDLDKVSDDDFRRYTMIRLSPGTHMYASFGHLTGYSSAYYTYMWDEAFPANGFV
jgi:thimet oligopeptidase